MATSSNLGQNWGNDPSVWGVFCMDLKNSHLLDQCDSNITSQKEGYLKIKMA